MTFSVIYDACVLFPPSLRDLLIRLAQKDVFQARWTQQILDEMVEGILRERADLSRSQLERTAELMCEGVRDCLVYNHETLIPALELPDSNDRHVLAAAIKSGAQVIVTSNLKDFPKSALEQWKIEAQSPDRFVLHVLELAPARVVAAIQQQADALRNPPMSVSHVLGRLKRNGLNESVAQISELMGVAAIEN